MRSLLFEHVDDLLIIMSKRLTIVDINEAAVAFLGYKSAGDVLGRRLTDVMTFDSPELDGWISGVSDTTDRSANLMVDVSRTDTSTAHLDAKIVWSAYLGRVFILARDVSDELRKRSAMAMQLAAMTEMAYTDVLTGLPNRLAYQQRIDARQEGAAGGWLVFCDLDGFKGINDTYGHPAGDLALAEVGRRLRNTVRGRDFVARIGGDEFALLLAGSMPEATLIGRLHYLVAKVSRPHVMADLSFRVFLSLGASYCEEGMTTEEWIKRADRALYEAKAECTNRVVVSAAED